MKLVFIHGAPAVGKLTTAKALLDRISGRSFDNHAAIDIARTLFEFGTPEFWELAQATRVRQALTNRSIGRTSGIGPKAAATSTRYGF
jgi:tRNA uridine 5-carbamoylmethylation protein Kti12